LGWVWVDEMDPWTTLDYIITSLNKLQLKAKIRPRTVVIVTNRRSLTNSLYWLQREFKCISVHCTAHIGVFIAICMYSGWPRFTWYMVIVYWDDPRLSICSRCSTPITRLGSMTILKQNTASCVFRIVLTWLLCRWHNAIDLTTFIE